MQNIDQIQWPGWNVVRLIGRGSFGAVYEIQRDLLGEKEKAALKVISIPQSSSDIDEMYSDGYDAESITSTFQEHLKSIVAEYSLMRKLNGSSNVVNCDDVRYVQHEDGFGWDIYIKMELLTPLTASLPETVSEAQVVKIGRDLCQALVQCKQFDIVHRDIKPQNIFVSPLGDYKLGDFGIAKTVEKTSGGTKIGTYKYMAPEVYNNQPYGAGADIYSLGLVLYWLLNERRMPFLPLPPEKLRAGLEEEARLRRFRGDPIPPPAHGSKQLQAIVLKACAYDPKDRFASAAEMLIALRSLKNGSGPMAGAVPIESATAIAGGNEADIAADEPTVAAKADDVEAAATEDEMTSVTVGRRRGEIEEPTVGVFGAGPYAVRQNQVQDSPSAGQQAGNHSHSKPAQQARNQSGSTLAIPAPKKTEEKRKKRGAATWIAIAAGLVVVISCVLLLTLGRGKNGGNEGNTEPALNSRPSEQSSTETPATELPATDTEPTPVELTGITVSRKPDKTSYDVGDYLDTSGLTLIVNYSDGTKETIREGFDYYPNLLNEAGQQEITVSYGGESTVFTVKVSAVIELTGMSIWSLPDKLSYNVGDQLNTSGLKIELTYSDGSQEVVSSGFECLPSTLTDAGSQTVYVNYDDYGATFVVEVSDPINYFDDNIAAYFALGDFKCFGMRYENPVLDNILSSYHYTSDIYDRDNTYFKINCFDVIPGYVGVSTLDDLTETLISALLAYGHGDDGLDKALWDNGWNIRCGFESIWGTVMEVEHEPTTGENCGYDFELTNGKYTATFITKPGGW